MSVSELQGIIKANMIPLLEDGTKATLRTILEAAENEAIVQARGIAVDPITTDPQVIQAAIATKRAELTAEAIMGFLNTMRDPMAAATAQAVVTYLNARSTITLIPGSLVIPATPSPIPVVATGPISIITY